MKDRLKKCVFALYKNEDVRGRCLFSSLALWLNGLICDVTAPGRTDKELQRTAEIGQDDLLPAMCRKAAAELPLPFRNDFQKCESDGGCGQVFFYGSKENESFGEPEESLSNVFRMADGALYPGRSFSGEGLHRTQLAFLKEAMSMKNQETQEHAERLVEIANATGLAMQLHENQLRELELLSSLHDIGKIGIRNEILAKPGRLTEDELREVHMHPEIGYHIAHACPEIQNVAELILSHHENWDGSGYPKGLRGEEIPLLSRITAVVDAYDAMTHDRVYRKALPKEEAIAEIIRNAGKQFDPRIVDVFIQEVLGEPCGGSAQEESVTWTSGISD